MKFYTTLKTEATAKIFRRPEAMYKIGDLEPQVEGSTEQNYVIDDFFDESKFAEDLEEEKDEVENLFEQQRKAFNKQMEDEEKDGET